jgi:hypothetical protein
MDKNSNSSGAISPKPITMQISPTCQRMENERVENDSATDFFSPNKLI